MGDPFSVAGTAVGITSLGIQTFQILYRYYGDFDSHLDDVTTILRHVEGLRGILEMLEGMKSELEHSEYLPSSLPGFEMTVRDCKEPLEKLQRMAEKCSAIDREKNWKTRLGQAQRRLIWPFRKETLKELQANLTLFKDNLSIALQCIGLDVLAQKLDGIRSTLDGVHENTVDIKYNQALQMDAIRAFRRDFASASINQGEQITDIAHELSELTLASRQQIAATQQLIMFVCTCGSGIGGLLQLTYLQMQSSQSGPGSAAVPSYLAAATQQLEQLQPMYAKKLQKYSNYSMQYQSNSILDQPRMCSCRRKARRSMKRVFGVLTSLEEVYDHQSNCPSFPHGEFSKCAAAHFTIHNRMLGFCVQLGWQWSRIQGWNTVAPQLRYRAVVSREDSPAFRLIDSTARQIMRCRYGDQGALGSLLKTTVAAIPLLFNGNSQPTDMDQYGNGLFNEILTSLVINLTGKEYHDSEAILMFLDACLQQGMLSDEDSLLWCQRLVLLAINSTEQARQTSTAVFRYVACRSNIVVPRIGTWNPHLSPVLYEMISKITKIEDVSENLDVDNDLLRSILQRSEVEFRNNIIRTDAKTFVSSIKTREIVSLLASWFSGLEIFFSLAPDNGMDDLVEELWETAISRCDAQCILTILQHQKSITLSHWESLNSSYEKLVNQSLRVGWKGVFQTVGPRLLAVADTDECGSTDKNIYSSVVSGSTKKLLYHTKHLCVEGAECAWSLGHRGLEEIRHFKKKPYLSGTALWIVSTVGNMSSAMWLLGHGANPTWMHSLLLTTPAHALARRAFRYEFHPNDRKFGLGINSTVNITRHLLGKRGLLVQNSKDNCACPCSLGGCSTITCALLELVLRFPVPLEVTEHKRALSDILSLVDRESDTHWMASAILRSLTFEGLHLTHTCCSRVFEEVCGFYNRPTQEEAEVVLKHEHNDIGLLQKLVVELEMSWRGYGKTFESFIWKIWRPRMQAVLRQQRGGKDEDEYKADLVGIGVVLEDPNKKGSWTTPETWLENFLSKDAGNEDEDEYVSADEEADDGDHDEESSLFEHTKENV